jgi:hypothetical protein
VTRRLVAHIGWSPMASKVECVDVGVRVRRCPFGGDRHRAGCAWGERFGTGKMTPGYDHPANFFAVAAKAVATVPDGTCGHGPLLVDATHFRS